MPGVFFRKERANLFEERFVKETVKDKEFWRVGKAGLIFKSKATAKSWNVKVGEEMCAATCEVDLAKNALKLTVKVGGKTIKQTVSEEAIAAMFDDKSDVTPIKAVVASLCKVHATASTNSPLVSGTVVENFAASKTYEGYKLKLDLKKDRVPFGNPFASGNEREFFLIGEISAGDCTKITFMGKTPGGAAKDQVVSESVSLIPFPK